MIAKFRYHSEKLLSYRKLLCIAKIQIFAMPAIFAMIAKFTMHSENAAPVFVIQTTPFMQFLFCPQCNLFILVSLVFFTSFVRLYKPLYDNL